ncbi:MAG: N-acetylmuramoyl-L-alanine amidase, partial [Microthrixaceae bacterium]
MKRLFSRAIPIAVIVTIAWMAPIPGLTPTIGAASAVSEPAFGIDDTDVAEIIESAAPTGAHVEILADALESQDGADEAPEHDSPGESGTHDDHGEPEDSGTHSEAEIETQGDHEPHAEAGHHHDESEPPDPDDLVVGEGEFSESFHTIGVTLDVESPVFLRVQDSDGQWQDWMSLEIDHSEGPDTTSAEATGDIATPPLFVEDGTRYEVVVSDEAAAGAEVVTVRDTTQWTVAVTEDQAAAATDTPFSMNARSEWTSRAARDVNVASAVNMAVVHHTVNPNSYSPSSVPSMLRGIKNYHMDGRGWSDIGYNFVVDKYGGIWEARGGGYDNPVIGAHAAGFNTGSVGISVLGDYTSATPSAATNESIAQVAGWKLFRHGNDPAETATFTSGGGPRFAAGTQVNLPRVVGHANVGSTSCPGSILNYLSSIRSRAQQVADFLVAVSVPLGGIDTLQVNGLTLSGTGWAIDPDLGGPARVDIRAGGITNSLTASIPRPDLAGQNTAYSTNRGWSGSVTSNLAGLQDYCATVVNQGLGTNNLPLSCGRTRFTDPSGRSPTGNISGTDSEPGIV